MHKDEALLEFTQGDWLPYIALWLNPETNGIEAVSPTGENDVSPWLSLKVNTLFAQKHLSAG